MLATFRRPLRASSAFFKLEAEETCPRQVKGLQGEEGPSPLLFRNDQNSKNTGGGH